MRIDDSSLKNLTSQPVRKSESSRVEAGYGKARDASTEETSGTTDTFALSSLSSAIRLQSEDTPERTAKLERLAKEYSSGRYQPDSIATSKKIVEDAGIHGSVSSDKPPAGVPEENESARYLGPPDQNG